MVSQPQRILTIEEEKGAEFGKHLDVELSDRLATASPDDDELQAAFGEVAGAYIVQDGGIPEYIPCSINEKVGRNRVTVRGYSPIDDTGTVRLVTSAYRNDGAMLGSSEFNSLVTFASNLVTVVEAGRELDDHHEVLELVKHIRDEIEDLREVRVIVVSNLRINADDLEAEGGTRRYRSEQYDIDRLYRISDVTIRRSDIQIDDFERMLGRGIPCIEVSGKDYNYKTYLMILDGETLYEIFERYGSKLYELNLRSYLQPKTGVNKKILDTIKTAPVRFLAYNNGICATADTIGAGLEHGQTVIRKLIGFQIVTRLRSKSARRVRRLTEYESCPQADTLRSTPMARRSIDMPATALPAQPAVALTATSFMALTCQWSSGNNGRECRMDPTNPYGQRMATAADL
jgi:hypothetical protein